MIEVGLSATATVAAGPVWVRVVLPVRSAPDTSEVLSVAVIVAVPTVVELVMVAV